MLTFLKANVSSLVASFCDYLITIFLVRFFQINVVAASAVGTICGGVINFLIGRYWAFSSKQDNATNQAGRYFLVWLGNLGLNTGGLYLLTLFTPIHYVPAKLIVSTVVAVGYNYPLQKLFVFKKI